MIQEKQLESDGTKRGRLTKYGVLLWGLCLLILINYKLKEPIVDGDNIPTSKQQGNNDQFQIKHIFHHGAGSKYYNVHRRLDITEDYLERMELNDFKMKSLDDQDEDYDIISQNLELAYRQNDWPRIHNNKNPWNMKFNIKSNPEKGQAIRLKERHTPGFIDSYLDYAREVKGNPKILNMINLEWEHDTSIEIPNLSDKDTMVSLALISSNAYVRFPQSDKEKKKLDWTDLGQEWKPDENNTDIEFGWDGEGVRGHVFVNEANNTVVIGIKGTSGAVIPGGTDDETTGNDKINDNLLFLCCCARISYMWSTVCDCYEKAYTCNQDCLEKELLRKDRYYQAALDIYRNVTALYSPDKYHIWVTGHSLGGSLASLLGRTYGLPAVAFEAPGELLATKRLHLPQPPGLPKHMENIWNIGNTADPIFMGVCNGASSTCNAAGYAMETACHTGKLCVYDVVTDKGWRVSVLNHRIHTVIDDIIQQYNSTPQCVEQPPCRDCFNWRFVSHDDDEGDEPKLPNPLLPHRSHSQKTSATTSKTISQSSTSTSTATSTWTPSSPTTTPTKTPEEKCVDRTWYGWCKLWCPVDGTSDDDRCKGKFTPSPSS